MNAFDRLQWRDYRDNHQQKTMTLSAEEFIRRFLLHVLPRGFHRICYYGFLGNRYRKEKLQHCRQLLNMTPPNESSSQPQPREDYRDRYERLTRPLAARMSSLPSWPDDRGQVIGRVSFFHGHSRYVMIDPNATSNRCLHELEAVEPEESCCLQHSEPRLGQASPSHLAPLALAKPPETLPTEFVQITTSNLSFSTWKYLSPYKTHSTQILPAA